ncbi:hypothetical protein GQ53DRAFT_747685 [Thozetella sp. PMI_491]|nr:hypothetical protein GQ53DRAFT_747685 [Thozetella sp. PMI_491]
MANTLGSNHAYASDSDMLMELKGVLSWAAGASGSSDYVCVFDLPLLGSDPRDAAQPLTSADGFINGAIDLLARMRRFLDANANFRLWSLRLGTVFSGFRYISGTPPRRRVADSQARAHRLLQRTSSKYREELPSAIMDVVMFGGQRLMTTEKGRLGLAPMGARRGDHIYMIEGCGTVVVLRAIEGHHEEFEYVGLAYMPSFNDSTTVQRCRGGEFQTELKLV